MNIRIIAVLILCFTIGHAKSQDQVRLASKHLKIEWQKTDKGFEIIDLSFKSADQWVEVEVLQGGKTYENYPFPDDKLPLFVGGNDCIILRKDDRLYAFYFPINFTGETFEFIYPDGRSRTTIQLPEIEGTSYELRTHGKPLDLEWDSALDAFFFPVKSGINYNITAKP